MEDELLLLPINIRDQLLQALDDGLTQSEIMLRSNCTRKWYFRYVQMLKRKGGFSWSLLFGDLVHRMLEAHYHELTRCQRQKIPFNYDINSCSFEFEFPDDVLLNPDQYEEERYWRNLAKTYLRRYAEHYRERDAKLHVIANEHSVDVKFRGFHLLGKIDLAVKETYGGGHWIVDHKTTYDINRKLLAGWQFRFQFLFYAWLYWRRTTIYPAGVYVNAIKKPAERRSIRKQESIDKFIKRIEDNIQLDPEKYFLRERLPLDKKTLPRFEKLTLDPILRQFEWIKHYAQKYASDDYSIINNEDLMSLLISINTDHCHTYNTPCEFIDLCTNSFQDFSGEYITRDIKHPEID
jgi:PD-(D/E)XK nuclease superfamily